MKNYTQEHEVLETPASSFSSEPMRRRQWDKAAYAGLLILILYSAIRSYVSAASKAFWFDEVCTWIMAHQPSVAAIWDALKHGADSNPPGFYMLEQAVSRVARPEEIAFRIPSILGFCCVLWCMFVFIRKRAGGLVALACATSLLITSLYGFTAEARPYSLMVACLSVALVAYQRAPGLGWTLLMAVSLALSQTFHYYSVFALAPFGLAEAVFSLKTRRLRLSVWLALLTGFLPLIALWAPLAELRQAYGSRYWAQPSVLGIAQAYGEFLHLPTALGLAAFATLGFGILSGLRHCLSPDHSRNADSQMPLHEYFVALGFLGMPFVGFLATRLGHGGFTPRYVLPTILGLPLAVGYIVPKLDRRAVALLAIFLSVGVGFQEVSFWRSHPGRFALPTASVEHLINEAGHPDLPVVISASVLYLPVFHYATPEWRKRFVLLADEDRAVDNTGTDNLETQLRILQRYAPLEIADFKPFTSEHRTFLLYSHKAAAVGDWWPPELAKVGTVELIAADGGGKVYLVSVNQPPQ